MSTDLITDFWTHIDSKFVKPSKTDEHLAIQIFKFILSSVQDKSVLPSLLSPNYMQYMLTKFSRSKKHDKDEILMAFKEILNSLVSIVNSDNTKSKLQIAVLKKLILHPGDLMIEKKTGTKVVQAVTGNLNLEGIKKVSKIYRNIIENTISKEKPHIKTESFWTNAERMYAAHLLTRCLIMKLNSICVITICILNLLISLTRLMGHYKMVVDQEWRLDQLKFLFVYGFCEMPNVGVDLARKYSFTSFFLHSIHKYIYI